MRNAALRRVKRRAAELDALELHHVVQRVAWLLDRREFARRFVDRGTEDGHQWFIKNGVPRDRVHRLVAAARHARDGGRMQAAQLLTRLVLEIWFPLRQPVRLTPFRSGAGGLPGPVGPLS